MTKWWINAILCLLILCFATLGIRTNDNIFFELGFFLTFYAFTLRIANVDREVGLANITLPLWTSRTLFPTQPNLFRGKTITFQALLVVSVIVSLMIYFLIPEVGLTSFYVQLAVVFGVGWFCDLSTKKKAQIQAGKRPDPRKAPNTRFWDDNKHI